MVLNLNLDIKELLDYIKRPYEEADVKELLGGIKPVVGYKILPIDIQTNIITITEISIEASYLAQGLKDCSNGIFLWATLGDELDKKIKILIKENQIYKATLLDEIASFAIDFLIDKVYLRLKQEYIKQRKFLTPRYSPGYGDISLAESEKLINLDEFCTIKYKNNMLIPQKSITAIVGVSNKSKTKSYPMGIGLCKGESCYGCRTWACMKE